MTSCMCKSCLVVPVKEEFAQFATIIAFGPFCFYFLDGIKNWIESAELNPYHCIWDTLKKIVHVLSCAGDHVYRVFILQSESWRMFHFVMWIFFDTSVARACVFLRRKNFLRHFLRVHYFWAVLCHCSSFKWNKSSEIFRDAKRTACLGLRDT